MDHSAAVFPEKHALTDTTGCRDLKAKPMCGSFFLNVVVFTIIYIVCVQGAQGSLQTAPEWLSSSGSWGSSLSSSVVNVAKRQTEVTSREESAESVDTLPKIEKLSSQEAAADETPESEPVTEGKESGGSADPKEGQATEGSAGQDPTQPTGQAETDKTGTKPSDENRVMPGLKGISSEAVLRGFYVFVGVGTIVLLYIVIKLLRLRRRRATRKYRVLSHNDDQEMFPLAADDGDDEEIYNAVDHQSLT